MSLHIHMSTAECGTSESVISISFHVAESSVVMPCGNAHGLSVAGASARGVSTGPSDDSQLSAGNTHLCGDRADGAREDKTRAARAGGRSDGRTNRQKEDRWIDGLMDRWIDGSMDRWIDGSMVMGQR